MPLGVALPAWLSGRRAAVATVPPPAAFDALIDLDPALGLAAEAVTEAVRAIPGAGWISAEVHPCSHGVGVRLFPPGSGQEADWPALRARVEAAVRDVPPSRAAATFAQPGAAAAVAGGFAEALSPTQFEALEQLAALAGSARTEPAAPDADEAEVMARLLRLAVPGDPATVAGALLRRFGSYAAVLAAPVAELREVAGLGTHGIAAVKLMHAAAVRLARAGMARRPVLSDPAKLAAYLSAALGRERIEQFRILFLDEEGMLTADEVQARGTVNHTPVYPREVVRRALALGAAAVVLVHNHPSGDPEPSREDVAMTRQVADAAEAMGVVVRDHVIIGNGRWLSFRAAGLL